MYAGREKDGQTGTKTLTVAFRDFVKKPKDVIILTIRFSHMQLFFLYSYLLHVSVAIVPSSNELSHLDIKPHKCSVLY
jgi:hypothetical protein